MFATIISGSMRKARNCVQVFCGVMFIFSAGWAEVSRAQELALATMPPSMTAYARAEAKPELALSLLERLETLEQLSESSAPAEIKALFAEGLPCQIHARTEDGVEVAEVHPLFSADTQPVEAEPASPAPAPLPKMTPAPRPVMQPMTPATSADAPFVTEKIKSLQKMVELMHAKEKLVQSRAYYERKLGEFDNKVAKE